MRFGKSGVVVVALVALSVPFFNRSGLQEIGFFNQLIGSAYDFCDNSGMMRPWVSSHWLKSGKTQGLFTPEPPHLAMLEASMQKGRAFFEGWYYKLVSEQLETVALIPIVTVGNGLPPDVHCAIMVADPSHPDVMKRVTYHRFEMPNCRLVDDSDFVIRMGNNVFRRNSVIVDIPGVVSGTISFSNSTPWPATLLQPTCMGWFAYIPGMQCNHGVVSFNHELTGSLSLGTGSGARELSFDLGRGYLEKDWGVQFPKNWIWIQCNHFYTKPDRGGTFLDGSSFIISVANIPFPGDGWSVPNVFEFQGFLGGLWDADAKRLYRVGTYTGAQVSLHFPHGRTGPKAEEVVVTVVDSQYKMVVRAAAKRSDSVPFWAPVDGRMVRSVDEMLNAKVDVTITRNRDGSVVFKGYGTAGGLEIQFTH